MITIRIIKIINSEMGANIAHLCGKYNEMFFNKLASLLKEYAIPIMRIIITIRNIALATILLMV